MGRHRSFTDSAGYTRHCWECKHAKGWRLKKHSADINLADCEQTGWVVKKFDSPDNPSSWMPTGCRYETEVDDGRVRG